ncbi:MAG TPA: DUF2461 domain-containing protein [Pedobacter sp.]|nr:DUF2461 domain-containing protein [Pedobacter sp.]
MIYPSTIDFLNLLKQNNNREWFTTRKDEFLREQAHVIEFAEEVLERLNKHDVIETPNGKKSIYRIYRDVRFSKDKTPFQTYWGGSFKRASKYRRGGYYYHIEQGNSLVVGGFWGPNSNDLKRIRESFEFDSAPFREILSSSEFIANFGKLNGDKLKTAPRGFSIDHPNIDLLAFKQFLLIKRFTDEEVLSESFAEQVDEAFRAMRPFLNYMSEVLSTDANGEPL